MSEDDEDSGQTKREKVTACLEKIERGFHRKWDNDPEFRDSLKGKDRVILIDLTDMGAWTLRVEDGKLQEIEEGRPDDFDVRLKTASEDFLAIFEGDLSPLKAYMTNKVKVKAGLRDIMLVKSFMS